MLVYIKRASQCTQYHMKKVIEALNDEGGYTLVKTSGGYAIDWSDDEGQERGSLVKCSLCGTVQDLWEGQPIRCAECLR